MPATSPTIGRKVWYWDRSRNSTNQAEDATVVFVHSDTCVNLRVTDHNGDSRPVHRVYLRQPDAGAPDAVPYCEWMPYQVQQHAKNSAANETAAKEVREAIVAVKAALTPDQ